MRSFILLISLGIWLTNSIAQEPPAEEGDFKETELLELIDMDSTLMLDIRYATTNNFVGQVVYSQARAFLQKDAAMALMKAASELRKEGYGLVIFDGYRPWSVTKLFWDLTPLEDREFVADPSKGSRHNRGCAIDLSLYDLATGEPVEMPTDYDEMNERSHPDYEGGSEEQRQLRDLLREKMEANGFTVYPNEWWHFDYKDWRSYRILNIQFEEIE